MASTVPLLPRVPSLLVNEPDRVLYELPFGKIDKKGRVVTQRAQKGGTCLFYAIKRILMQEQIRSPHGKLCSKLRKEYTKYEANAGLQKKAIQVFLKAKGREPVKEAEAMFFDLAAKATPKNNSSKHTPNSDKDTFQLWPDADVVNRLELECSILRNAADRVIIKDHGLKGITYKDLETAPLIITALRTHGPLLIGGHFGKSCFGKMPSRDFKLGTLTLHGWGNELEEYKGFGSTHALVITGAEAKRDEQYVYWVDPNDPNIPEDPDSQVTYFSPLEPFLKGCVVPFVQTPIWKLPAEAKSIECAFYNPAFELLPSNI